MCETNAHPNEQQCGFSKNKWEGGQTIRKFERTNYLNGPS